MTRANELNGVCEDIFAQKLNNLIEKSQMKAKIFNALKTNYSQLGLGDEILQEHADALAKLGLVTDDNLNVVISAQGDYLAKLQKLNDKRVNEAVAKTKKEAEDEAAKRKAEEDAKAKAAAEEAAKKKAEEEAAAKKAAEEAAAKKAAEEEAARKAEELRKNNEIPEWFKKMQEESMAAAKKQQEAYEAQIKAMQEAAAKSQKQYEESFKQLNETNAGLLKGYEAMKKEAEDAKAAKAKIDRQNFILNKAKELGVPQWRIDEGFVIANDATEDAITAQLSTIANNVKTNVLPNRPNAFPMAESGEISKEELKSIAQSIVR